MLNGRCFRICGARCFRACTKLANCAAEGLNTSVTSPFPVLNASVSPGSCSTAGVKRNGTGTEGGLLSMFVCGTGEFSQEFSYLWTFRVDTMKFYLKDARNRFRSTS